MVENLGKAGQERQQGRTRQAGQVGETIDKEMLSLRHGSGNNYKEIASVLNRALN